MKSPPTHCPTCNSIQRFAPKRRDKDGQVEIYIHCLMCKTETVLETLANERLAKIRVSRAIRTARRRANGR